MNVLSAAEFLIGEIENALPGADKKSATQRIFALLGPNGAGKSNLLQYVDARLGSRDVPSLLLPPHRPVSVRGEVTVGHIASDPAGAQALATVLIEQMVNSKRKGKSYGHLTFETLLSTFLWRLIAARRREKEQYRNALEEWSSGPRTEPAPPYVPDPLKLLETKIQEILGYPTTIVGETPLPQGGSRLSFKRPDGSSFTPERLSDGEKQILLISMFLIDQSSSSFVFLADEPELYLNEALACKIWSRVEDAFPHVVFVYATHSPVFATRPTVQATFLLRMDQTLEKIDRSVPVPPTVMHEIVGARIQILRSEAKPIFCEDALSEMILEDVMRGRDVLPIALHGWQSVAAASKGEGPWQALRSKGPAFCGVIDRDTWSEREIEGFAESGIVPWPRYDAESLLLDPVIACWSLSNTAGQTISIDEWTDILCEAAVRWRGRMLDQLRRHMRREDHVLTFDHDSSGVSNIVVKPSPTLAASFKRRADQLFDVVQRRDVNAILTLYKGKLLYEEVVRIVSRPPHKVNLTLAPQRYRDLRNMSDFAAVLEQVSWITDLRANIEKRLAG